MGKTKEILLDLNSLNMAAECLKVLAHPVRLRMLQILSDKEYSVGELASTCDIKSNVASEHLRLMQRCQFLSAHKVGTSVYYKISEPHIFEILSCLQNKFSK